ncbi:prepilin peptidase [Rahnella sp. PCH160]|uniref:prepilin peptidase n=1 Tax=Rahnella sp. PCH160 TaxID=3447928 RepID=UPI0039FC8D80
MEEIWRGLLGGRGIFTYSLQVGSLVAGLFFGRFFNAFVCHYCPKVSSKTDSGLLPDFSTSACYCQDCKHVLSTWQNIRLFNELLLKPRGYYCHERISLRYSLAELTCGLLFLSISFVAPSLIDVIQICVFAWFLIALSMIDCFTLLLPDALTQPLMWLGLLLSVSGFGIPLEFAVLGSILGYLSLWILYWIFRIFTGQEGIGYGDLKLLAAIGAWVGFEMLPLVCTLAAFSGIVFWLCWKATGRSSHLIPFGPGLSSAGLLIYICQKSHMLWLM